MTLKEFRPSDSTGEKESDMLFREEHHTSEDVKRAKAYLRRNFDVVSIEVIKETK